MAADKRFLDDMARMAGGAASLLSTVKRQISSDLKDKVDSYSSKMDFGDKNEIDRLRAMVSKLRLEQEDLKARVASLEASTSGKTKAAPKKTAVKKPSAKKPKRK